MVVLAASARLDAADVLRIGWARPPDGDPTIVLRRADAGASDAAEAEVPFDGDTADLSRLDLAAGVWMVYASGAEVITTDPGFSLDGLADYARRPRTRALRAFRAPSGGLRIEVRTVEAYAEVTAVHPGENLLAVEGYVAFGTAPADTEITAVRRETLDRVTGEATVAGGRWRAELPNAGFAAETGEGMWDLRLGELALATRLDDIPNKKQKVRFPERYVAREDSRVDEDGRVRVQAQYTDRDRLAIATTAVASPEAP